MSFKNTSLKKIVGSRIQCGGSATVYNHKTLKNAVVKVYNTPADTKCYETEVLFYKTVKPSCYIPTFHYNNSQKSSSCVPAIVRKPKSTNYLVLEKCMCNLTDDMEYTTLDEQLVILVDILESLQYIHSNNYIHNDIHTDNVFIKYDGTAILGDFGHSLKIGETDNDTTVTVYDRIRDMLDFMLVACTLLMGDVVGEVLYEIFRPQISELLINSVNFAIIKEYCPNVRVAHVLKTLFETLRKGKKYIYTNANYTSLIKVLTSYSK